MDILGPLFLFCGWHFIVLAIGIAIGHYKPWRWRIVRPGAPHPQAVGGGNNHQHPQYYDEVEEDVFRQIK